MMYKAHMKLNDDKDNNDNDDHGDDDDIDDIYNDNVINKFNEYRQRTSKKVNKTRNTEKQTMSKPAFTLPPPHQPKPPANAPTRTLTYDQVVTASNIFGEKSDNDLGIYNSMRHKPYTHFVSIPVGKIASAHKSAL